MTKSGDTATVDQAAESLGRDLEALARSWAAYGLTVGKLAVEQSARSMERLARVLDSAALVLAGMSQGLKDDAQAEGDADVVSDDGDADREVVDAVE